MRSSVADRAAAGIRRQSWSVGAATGAYGISFGALSVAAGLSVPQTCALSLLMFSGASQFAFVSIVGTALGGVGFTAGAAGAAVGTAGLLGVRNGFYAVSLAPVLATRGWHRPAAAQLTIDESTAVSTAARAAHPERPELSRLGFWTTGVAVFVLWNLATLCGAVVGDRLGDPRQYGLDAAAAAAFIALLWPRLGSRTSAAVAVAAVAVALLLVPLTPLGIPVLAAAGVGVLAAAATR